MVLQMEIARQNKFLLEIYRQNVSVGDSGISSKYFQLPVKCQRTVSLCKFIGECGVSTTLWNADGLYPSVNSLVIVAFAQSYYEMPTDCYPSVNSSVMVAFLALCQMPTDTFRL
jgi:hypothetical protein